MGIKEKLENHLGLVIGGFVVASFAAGFAAYKAHLEAANQDVVTHGTYLLLDEVRDKYVSKATCKDQIALGYSHEELASRLLDLLQPSISEKAIISNTLHYQCAGSFVVPEAKVEILAYLNVGEEALRHKAILAYANCASGVNEAFLLARTIKTTEPPANFDAYAFSLWAIVKHGEARNSEARYFDRMKDYLVEIHVPSGLLAAFLARESSQPEGRVSESGDKAETPNPGAAPDG